MKDHRKPGGTNAADSSAREQPAPGKLPGSVQQQMETAFGRSFDDVRVHVGSEASGMGAQAFARGKDIHFAPDEYDPGSQSGLELIGHELAHVVQQAEGRVAGNTQARGVVANEDCSLEAEADRAGAAAARGERVTLTSSRADTPADGPVVQGKFILPAGAGDRGSGPSDKELHVADDASLAVVPGTKHFSATPERITESNKILEAVNSTFRLADSGNNVRLFSVDGHQQQLSEVVAENRKEHTSGKGLTGPVRCNEMAEAVVGKPQVTHATTTGLRTDGSNFGVDMATYEGAYDTAKSDKHAAGTEAVDRRHEALSKLPQTPKYEHGYEITIIPSDKIKKERKKHNKSEETGKTDELAKRLFRIVNENRDVLQSAQANKKGYQRVLATDPGAEKLLAPLVADGLCREFKVDKAEVYVGLDKTAQGKQDDADAQHFKHMKPSQRDQLARELRTDAYAEPDIGESYGIFPVRSLSEDKNAIFPYHFGGVVAKAGADTVTLENFFMPNRNDASVFFNLYGPLQNVDVKHALMGKVTPAHTTEEERASGSFHAKWSGSFKHDSPVTTSLGTSKRAAHPGEVRDGNDEAAWKRAADLFAYWQERWRMGHDADVAKTALDELGRCPTALNGAIDKGLIDVGAFKTLRQQLMAPETAPRLASWGLGPVKEQQPRGKSAETEEKSKDEEVEVKHEVEATTYEFDRALSRYRRAGESEREAAAKEALGILQRAYDRIQKHYKSLDMLEDLDDLLQELLAAAKL